MSNPNEYNLFKKAIEKELADFKEADFRGENLRGEKIEENFRKGIYISRQRGLIGGKEKFLRRWNR